MMRKVKASALYIVIVISLFIGVVCAAIIAGAYYYKIQFQRKNRYDQLDYNLSSGINILLASPDTAFANGRTFSLFNGGADSVYLKKIPWGIFILGVAEAFRQNDTLFRTFTIGAGIDSSKWCALYLANNFVPLSLSGKTSITGSAYLPEAGIIQAFVNNKAYSGDKRLVVGKRLLSKKDLPQPDATGLKNLYDYFMGTHHADPAISKDSLVVSARSPTKIIKINKAKPDLKNVFLEGNIIIECDTTLYIDSSAVLNNIIVFSKAIEVEKDFKGKCQLFATDSIHVGKSCSFGYPSCLGIMALSDLKNGSRKISIDSASLLNGVIFTWQASKGKMPPMIDIAKNVIVNGEIYSMADLKLNNDDKISGCIFTNDFVYKNSFTFYRGYLVDVTINSTMLSPYFLTSSLFPVASKKRQVLQWLESN